MILLKKPKRDNLLRAKINSIDYASGRIGIFTKNGLKSVATYLGNISDLRVGNQVLVGKVDDAFIILNKLQNPIRNCGMMTFQPAVVPSTTHWEDFTGGETPFVGWSTWNSIWSDGTGTADHQGVWGGSLYPEKNYWNEGWTSPQVGNDYVTMLPPRQSIVDGKYHYECDPSSNWEDNYSYVNDGFEFYPLSSSYFIEHTAHEFYIKYDTTTTFKGAEGPSVFYVLIHLSDDLSRYAEADYGNSMYLCLVGSNSTYASHPTLYQARTKGVGGYRYNVWYLSMPGVSVGNWNISNDGTVPITVPWSTPIRDVAIEMGFDAGWTFEMDIDFIDIK
jgi:hypothetical protein